MKRITSHFSGHVQGVGFRHNTLQVAERHAVAGYVKNLSDGRVEIVAEGEDAEVDGFLREVEKTMSGYIRDRQVNESPGTGKFKTFDVAY